MQLPLSEIAAMLGADADAIKNDTLITTLLTDSRSLSTPENTIFFAIHTATNNGANYIPELYSRGVRAFVLTKESLDKLQISDMPDATFISVVNPVEALQLITRRRENAGGNVVMIIGRRGKTTLKEWLFQLLEPFHQITRSPRSYNSQIGVPLSMWEISDSTDLTLVEAGMSEKGELQRLTACIRPDTVIVTDLKKDETSAASDHPETDDSLISEFLIPIKSESVKKVVICDDDSDFFHAVEDICRRQNKELVAGSFAPSTAEDSAIDPQQLKNASLALSFMRSEGIAEETAKLRMSRLHPVATRLSVSEGANECSIIYDSYISDFSSLIPAVDFMMRRRTDSQNMIAILGDPHHESHSDEEVFKKIASNIPAHNVGKMRIYGVGPRFFHHKDMFKENDRVFENVADLLAYLRDNPPYHSQILLKGADDFEFLPVKDLLEERTHQTMLEVNLDAMIHNYNYFKSHLPKQTGMIAMVKASGYGAGSYEIAKTLQDAGAAYLAVAVLDEGIALRQQGITMPIMVMNPGVGSYREMFSNHLEPEIYTLGMLRGVISQAEKYGASNYPIHLKLDTGMHRMGLVEEELSLALEILNNQNRVRISSVFSHLATADCPDLDDYTMMQLSTFERYSSFLLSGCGYHFRRHILNSAGILRFPEYHYDMARLGIGLYGVNTLPAEMEEPLEVVSSLKTVIINLREWKAGTSIGYARKQILEKDSRIATIPIGYADGMSRRFGNGKIHVLINGKEAPTVGNICMDACMIDVTGIECNIGDSVEIFGTSMPVSRLSDVLDTIPYEILTSISPRVKRVYYRE